MTRTATAGDQSLADIVTADPARARVLERFGLDYCCGGQRRLGDACVEAGADLDVVLEALAAISPAPAADWASMPTAELVDHLEATHHQYLHAALPRLAALADKVAGVHGGRHPELAQVQASYRALQGDLEPHLFKEEHVLFPLIRQLAADRVGAPAPHCGSLELGPIRVMLLEHDRAGELLADLRALTGGYEAPDDACASYHALYTGLAELEADTHLHVHKENNVLFPAVIALEHETAG